MLFTALQYANMGLAFALELGVVAALCYFGFVIGRSRLVKIALGLGLPTVAIIIWGLFGSPQADWRLSGLWFLLLQIIWFGSAAVSLYAARKRGLSVAFALIFVLNTTLAYAWGQQLL